MNSKKIIVVGAGGFAKEVLGYLYSENSKLIEEIEGVIVDDYHCRDILPLNLPYLGSIKEHEPRDSKLYLVCIGENPGRRKVIELLKSRGASFYTYRSKLAYIHPDTSIGEGSIIAPFCIVNAEAKLGNFAMLNSFSAVGHDSVIGDHAILNPYAAVNGRCCIGDNLLMGTRATVFPGTMIGDNCTITSHSYVKKNKGDNRFIHIKSKEVDLENRL